MELYFSIVLHFFIQMITGSLFFTYNLKNVRKFWYLRAILSIGISLVISYLFFLLAQKYNWNYLTNLVIYLVMFICLMVSYIFTFNYKIKEAIIVLTISYCVQHISYQLSFLLAESWILDTRIINTILASSFPLIYLNYIFLGFQFILNLEISFVLQRFFKKNYKYSISSQMSLGFSIFTLLVVIVLYTYILKSPVIYFDLILRVVISIFCIIFCIFIIMLIIGTFAINKRRDDALKMNMFYKDILNQYHTSKEAVEFINIKIHDLKKIMNDNKNKMMSEDDIDSITKAISLYEESYDTNNDYLNGVLTSKAIIFNKYDIKVSIMADGELLNKVFNENEIISLFTNIFDNAIEALLNIEDKNKRYINLIIKNKANFLYIEESNPTINDVSIVNNSILTTKLENKSNHGYGTKSIALTIKKHNGKVKFEKIDDHFYLKIIVPINK